MQAKTLVTIILSLALGSVGCDKTNESQEQTYNISGKIVNIDEDSFAIEAWYKGANFEFEHFRIEASDGKIYKLIFPGPANYLVGDVVNFRYRAQSRVSYHDLLNNGSKNIDTSLLQDGFFEVDGLIQR